MRQIPPWSHFGLHVVVKPIGPICNLRCRYCFYLEKESLYRAGESWRMNDENLEAYIRQYIEAQPATTQDINFTFQGGEPTLMGIDFFRRAVEQEQKYLPSGKRASNSLQTNGVLLDDQWCGFLRENRFLVGLSLDGPEELHDAYRTDPLGHGSFDRVMRGLRLMQRHGVDFNAICCIHRRNGDHPGASTGSCATTASSSCSSFPSCSQRPPQRRTHSRGRRTGSMGNARKCPAGAIRPFSDRRLRRVGLP